MSDSSVEQLSGQLLNIALGSDHSDLDEEIDSADTETSDLHLVAGLVDELHILKNSITVTPATEREYEGWEAYSFDIAYTNLHISVLSKIGRHGYWETTTSTRMMIPSMRYYRPEPRSWLLHGSWKSQQNKNIYLHNILTFKRTAAIQAILMEPQNPQPSSVPAIIMHRKWGLPSLMHTASPTSAERRPGKKSPIRRSMKRERKYRTRRDMREIQQHQLFFVTIWSPCENERCVAHTIWITFTACWTSFQYDAGEKSVSSKALTVDDIDKIYRIMEENEGQDGELPMALIHVTVTIAFTCLLRIDEVLNLQFDDVVGDENRLTITLKSRKTAQFGGEDVWFDSPHIVCLTWTHLRY